jgi:sulfate transport system permease protein
VGRTLLILIAVGFLVLFVVLPAVNVFAQALSKGWDAYVTTLHAPKVEGQEKLPLRERRALAKQQAQAEKTWSAIRMTLGVAAVVVPLNVAFGVAAAWAISKFRFRGRSLLVSLIDLPFSVSPVVAGLVFVLLMGRQGFFGHWAMNWEWPEPLSLYWKGFSSGRWPLGFGEWQTGVIFTPLATVLASVFVTFPFVARSLIPLMESQGTDAEQAAISLGAGGFKTFWRVTLPNIKWGLIYGVILCTARAMGEFGAVSVVSGHLDANDTMPLRVEKLWNEYNTQAAFTVASLLALLAVVTLVLKTVAEWKARRDLEDSASP